VIGNDGTIYCSGYDFGSKLYAVNPNGTIKWESTNGGLCSHPAIGNDGTIYSTSDEQLFATNMDGSLKWKYSLNRIVYYFAGDPYIGNNETIYAVTGGTAALMAFDANGALKWLYRDFNAFNDGIKNVLSIGSDGTVYISVASSSGNTIQAITESGQRKWAYAANNSSPLSSATIDNMGTIYFFERSFSRKLVALNPDGTFKWSLNMPSNPSDISPIIGPSGTVYIGTTAGTLYAYGNTTSVRDRPSNDQKHFSLQQNYPNPFNASTVITFFLPNSTHVALKVYNLQGKEMEVLINAYQVAGKHEIKWTAEAIPSGIYVYRLQAGQYAEVKKLILLK